MKFKYGSKYAYLMTMTIVMMMMILMAVMVINSRVMMRMKPEVKLQESRCCHVEATFKN